MGNTELSKNDTPANPHAAWRWADKARVRSYRACNMEARLTA
jgi:hypothetical protein